MRSHRLQYVAHGSLHSVLRLKAAEFDWRRRLKVAVTAAAGLAYLHTRTVRVVVIAVLTPAAADCSPRLEERQHVDYGGLLLQGLTPARGLHVL